MGMGGMTYEKSHEHDDRSEVLLASSQGDF